MMRSRIGFLGALIGSLGVSALGNAQAARSADAWPGGGRKRPRPRGWVGPDHEEQRRLRRKRWKADKPRRIRKAKRAARKRQRA